MKIITILTTKNNKLYWITPVSGKLVTAVGETEDLVSKITSVGVGVASTVGVTAVVCA